jgi:hypothetical protein
MPPFLSNQLNPFFFSVTFAIWQNTNSDKIYFCKKKNNCFDCISLSLSPEKAN